MAEKPLQTTVTAKQPSSRPEFVVRALDALRREPRVEATAVGGVVEIRCTWYADLDLASKVLASVFSEELVWTEPKIILRYETLTHRGKPTEFPLEPILKVAVTTPPEFVGYVIGDLSARRSLCTGQRDNADGTLTIEAEVPLVEMRGYTDVLRRFTAAAAKATAEFLKYELCPPYVGPPPDEPMSAALRA